MIALTVLSAWTVIASGVTAGLFAWDKRRAVRDGQRFSEQTLLLWSAAGGWPGGLWAARRFRHKTRKFSFRVRFVIATMVHLGWSAGVAYLVM